MQAIQSNGIANAECTCQASSAGSMWHQGCGRPNGLLNTVTERKAVQIPFSTKTSMTHSSFAAHRRCFIENCSTWTAKNQIENPHGPKRAQIKRPNKDWPLKRHAAQPGFEHQQLKGSNPDSRLLEFQSMGEGLREDNKQKAKW